MLRDESFARRAKVDRYGRPLPKDAGRKELERFYRVEDDTALDNPEDIADEDNEVEAELERLDAGIPSAKAEEDSSSSSDDSSSEDEEEEVTEQKEILFPDQHGDYENGIPTGEVTSRIAVVNLDWDNIRAVDLMAVFSSFAPSHGRIFRVAIYPSQFGKERMEREEMEGPPQEIFGQDENQSLADILSGAEDDESDENTDTDEKIKNYILKEDRGEEFNPGKLRRYQLERLRYFYAVLSCSSKEVAQAIYDAVDGTEYLTSANFFDLRFILDEVDFSSDKVRDECDRIPDGYRPTDFVTDALQHSKVTLTWDADDGVRKEVQKKAFAGSRADIDENDLKAYLGSDSSEDEAPEPVVIDATSSILPQGNGDGTVENPDKNLSKKDRECQRMRALLGLQNEPSKKKMGTRPMGDMQVTFSSGLSSAPSKRSVFENEPEREETTVEKYVRKEKERKARRKDKAKQPENAMQNLDEQDGANEALAAIKVVPKTDDLGFQDPFFIAPADDKAASTSLRKDQKRQKREQRTADEAISKDQRAELELLLVDDKIRGDVNHFDINELAKAEKAKKKKPSRLSEREKEVLKAKEQDDFQINVEDPRFQAVYERSDFAIDPTNPRFKATEGMKALLNEGRKKRKRKIDDIGTDDIQTMSKEQRAFKKEKAEEVGNRHDRGEDVQKLLARVKNKTKNSVIA